MPKNKNKLVDQLSDSLNTLEDFEKFMAKFISGHYDNLPDAPHQKTTATYLDQTKSVLLWHVINTVKELNGTK